MFMLRIEMKCFQEECAESIKVQENGVLKLLLLESDFASDVIA